MVLWFHQINQHYQGGPEDHHYPHCHKILKSHMLAISKILCGTALVCTPFINLHCP
jgi:hypothetical protein